MWVTQKVNVVFWRQRWCCNIFRSHNYGHRLYCHCGAGGEWMYDVVASILINHNAGVCRKRVPTTKMSMCIVHAIRQYSLDHYMNLRQFFFLLILLAVDSFRSIRSLAIFDDYYATTHDISFFFFSFSFGFIRRLNEWNKMSKWHTRESASECVCVIHPRSMRMNGFECMCVCCEWVVCKYMYI